ncbi:MAG: FAD-binding oxidoreductase [Nitrospirota bacterium]|nr:FAD-binding oxidoreductase [Nitrospirota bacterium]
MTARPIRAKVLKIQHLTRDIREMTLEMLEPSALVFRPGQSIAVTVPDPNSDLPLLRYFSLASPPRSSRHLVLLLNSHDHGKGSKFLLEREPGAELQVAGPYGSFILHQEIERELLFIGTGTGIAPLWSMLATLLEEPSSQSMTLLWGLRSEVDRYYLEELEVWKATHSNFSYILTLSQPSSGWQGKRGRVTDLVQERSNVKHVSAYVCGNRSMVKEVTELLTQKGAGAIYRERHADST